jgi:ribose/xylose/arabinose/galactoside ABC-type transport system permease subunit
MSRLGQAFYAFALLLLPVLAFVGVVTFLRLVQSSIEDIAYAERIARLRDFYLSVAPELEPYLLVAQAPTPTPSTDGKRALPSSWQLTLTTAGMVAVVNSVVIGACVGLLIAALGVDTLAVPVAGGFVSGGIALSVQHRHHLAARDRYRPDFIDRAAITRPGPPPDMA